MMSIMCFKIIRSILIVGLEKYSSVIQSIELLVAGNPNENGPSCANRLALTFIRLNSAYK